MYIPAIYKNEDLAQVRAFLAANSFGILVSQSEGKPWATHIPMEISEKTDGKTALVGHISKANLQVQLLANGGQFLAIFSGAHSYISSSWYDHENVPTWNYIAVHIYGTIRILTEDELLESLSDLVDKYEKTSKKPVSVAQMSEKMLKREMRGIVGFELQIEEIQAARKLSQNRDNQNHENIVHELEKTGDKNAMEIANEMRKDRI